jgi:hypothetical protein
MYPCTLQTLNADFVPYVVGDDDAYTMANLEAIEFVENKFQELKDCKEFQRTMLQTQTATNDRLASLESSVTKLLVANTSMQSRLALGGQLRCPFRHQIPFPPARETRQRFSRFQAYSRRSRCH